MMPTGV
jgi:hypothetical protein